MPGILCRTGYISMPSFCVQRRFAFFLAFILPAVGAASAATVQSPKQQATATAKSKDGASALSVEVINGTSRRTVVLQGEDAHAKTATAPHRKTASQVRRHRAATQPPMTAVILNGTQKETHVFNSTAEVNRPIKNLPPVVIGIATVGSKNQKVQTVVVGISSSGSASSPAKAQQVVVNVASSESNGENGNAQPVVVGISSTGAQTAGTVAPVAVGVSPRPAKRRPYRPATLDAQ
jgi:hypothetical protein